MSKIEHLHLFEGFGIEIEYMLVERQTGRIAPVSDQVLTRLHGSLTNEVELGDIAWSNELVLHVLEIKTNGPKNSLPAICELFQTAILKLNPILEELGVMLLPSAMHPTMDPSREMHLWPHDNSIIYDTYNEIFGCRGHGWSNLQSIHINLPFGDESEFGRLHAAIRLVLPLLASLAASSPLVEGKLTGLLDNRLEFYRLNQKKVPAVTGHVIPERVFTFRDYEEKLLQKIYQQIAPYDPKGTLQEDWLNSRGAITRFERNAIEIRLLDSQECARADLAVVSAVVALVRALVNETWCNYETQKSFSEIELEKIFLASLQLNEKAQISNPLYLKVFGYQGKNCQFLDLWQHVTNELMLKDPFLKFFAHELAVLFKQGSLARRITASLPAKPSPEEIRRVYYQLSQCLIKNAMFEGL